MSHKGGQYPESAVAGHDGTLMAQKSWDRIFVGPGEAGDEKNCKVKPGTSVFWVVFSSWHFIFWDIFPILPCQQIQKEKKKEKRKKKGREGGKRKKKKEKRFFEDFEQKSD